MKARDAKVGHKYLTQKGTAATMTGHKDGKIVMTLASGIVFRCGPDYELKPVNCADGKAHNPKAGQKDNAAQTGKAAKVVTAPEQKNTDGGNDIGATAAKPPHGVSLASIIDPFLLSGGHTVGDIAIEVRNKAGNAAQGKDVEANVRARMVTYTRKGWRVVKDENKRVKVVQGKV
ncbi:MAG: hypothetical protein WC421_01575 [Elusimicrobiales bacterium]